MSLPSTRAAPNRARPALTWKLLRVEQDYQWYRDGTAWKYEPVTSTKQVSNGTLDVTTDGGEIAISAGWGRYRLEVETADIDGPASSVEFDSGWYVTASSTETPDGLEVALDKQNYAIGDTAKLRVSPRFAGEVLVTIGSEKLIATKTASIPAEGGEVGYSDHRRFRRGRLCHGNALSSGRCAGKPHADALHRHQMAGCGSRRAQALRHARPAGKDVATPDAEYSGRGDRGRGGRGSLCHGCRRRCRYSQPDAL